MMITSWIHCSSTTSRFIVLSHRFLKNYNAIAWCRINWNAFHRHIWRVLSNWLKKCLMMWIYSSFCSMNVSISIPLWSISCSLIVCISRWFWILRKYREVYWINGKATANIVIIWFKVLFSRTIWSRISISKSTECSSSFWTMIN